VTEVGVNKFNELEKTPEVPIKRNAPPCKREKMIKFSGGGGFKFSPPSS
jgi:hypothetical protein